MIELFVRKGPIFLNTNKYKFETLEELQQTYPIHSIFSKRIEHHIDVHTYYNNSDLKIFTCRSDKIEILDDTTCITYKTITGKRMVDGYLYDGEYWYPAYITHDGWVEYNESDIFKEEEVTFDSAKYRRKYP
jgi:hypothetical protein